MTREEAIKILRREIECLSHTKCEDCILEAGCNPIKTTPYDSEYIEVYEMAIKALKTLDKIYKACERYEKQGDNYFGYIKICVAKDIAKEIMPKQAVCESCVHWKPLIYKPGAQAVGCELALMGCPYEPKTKGSDKE